MAAISKKWLQQGSRMEPVSLDVNEVCFEEEQDIPNTHQNSRNYQGNTEWYRCGK